MTLSERKREQLIAFLGGLPTATAVKLFAAIEADRDTGGAGLPHHEIIEDLRARLLAKGAQLPARRRDARRVFFTPFEDFYVGERIGRKRVGVIPRRSLPAIWNVLMRESALSEAAFAAGALDEALSAGRDTQELETALFIAAEAGIGRLLNALAVDAERRAKICAMLGGEDAFADLQELRRLLAGAGFFKELHKVLPAGAGALSDDTLYALRKVFLSAYEQSPGLASFLLLSIKGRLEKPWQAMAFYYHLMSSADDRAAAARDAAAVLAESLFEDLEALARTLESDGAAPEKFDPQAATLRVTWFADYADGLAAQARKGGDSVSLNRIDACREVAGDAFERFCELALAALREVMPVRRSGGASILRAQRPDYHARIIPRVLAHALASAEFIAQAALLAGRLGATAAFIVGIADEAREKATLFANDLVMEIRAAEGEDRDMAERMLDQVLSACGPLLDREQAGLIRDRAKAAAIAV